MQSLNTRGTRGRRARLVASTHYQSCCERRGAQRSRALSPLADIIYCGTVDGQSAARVSAQCLRAHPRVADALTGESSSRTHTGALAQCRTRDLLSHNAAGGSALGPALA